VANRIGINGSRRIGHGSERRSLSQRERDPAARGGGGSSGPGPGLARDGDLDLAGATMTGTFTDQTAHGTTEAGRPRAAARVLRAGGALWILATLQYAVVQVVVAAAWHHPPYSWLSNYISDLGNTACGRFTVPHGTPAYVCSPLHATMNGSFIATGILTIAGAVLLRRLWPHGRLAAAALVLWVITGLGKVAVGLVPENTNISLHLLAAFNIPVGCAAILLLSLAIRRAGRAVSIAGIVLAALGLAGTALSTAGQFAGSALYLGLGAGGMERVADYPGSLWVLMIGILAVLTAATRGEHHAAEIAVQL
jgi:hypothetical membrane protein